MNIKTCHICNRTLYKKRNSTFKEKEAFSLKCYNTKHNFVIFQDFSRKLKYNVSAIKILLNIDNKYLYTVFRFNEENIITLELKDYNYNLLTKIENFNYISNYLELKSRIKNLLLFI